MHPGESSLGCLRGIKTAMAMNEERCGTAMSLDLFNKIAGEQGGGV